MHIALMQRRPLQPIPFESQYFPEGLPRLLAMFFDARDRDKPQIENSLYRFEDYAEAFQAMGLSGRPVSKNACKAQNPKAAPMDDHPTGYLAWGAECVSNTNCYFAMGDYARLIRFDFKMNKDDSCASAFIQLDQLRIWDGDNLLSVPCNHTDYEGMIAGLMHVVSETTHALNSGQTQAAKRSFEQLSPFISQLHRERDLWRREPMTPTGNGRLTV